MFNPCNVLGTRITNRKVEWRINKKGRAIRALPNSVVLFMGRYLDDP